LTGVLAEAFGVYSLCRPPPPPWEPPMGNHVQPASVAALASDDPSQLEAERTVIIEDDASSSVTPPPQADIGLAALKAAAKVRADAQPDGWTPGPPISFAPNPPASSSAGIPKRTQRPPLFSSGHEEPKPSVAYGSKRGRPGGKRNKGKKCECGGIHCRWCQKNVD